MKLYEKYLNERKTLNLSESMGGKRNTGFNGIDEIGEFWLVTKGSEGSEMVDVISKIDVFDLYLQLKGGLKGREIVGLYKNESKAKKQAEKELRPALPAGWGKDTTKNRKPVHHRQAPWLN